MIGVQAASALESLPALDGPEAAIRFIEEGDRHHAADELDKAVIAYRKAVNAAPLNTVTHQRLGYAYSLLGQLDDAEREDRKAIDLDRTNGLAHANLGWVYGRMGRFRAAIAEEKLAIESDPDLAIAYQTLGLALTSVGDYPDAVKSFEVALQLDPDDLGTYLNLAAALGRKGDYAGAVSVYRKAISLNRNSMVAHLGLGTALGKLGDKHAQIDEFQKAVALSPKNPMAHGKLGWALSQSKDWRGALREGIITNTLRIEASSGTFFKAFITVWAAVFLVFGSLFAFVFSGSRFKPQPGEEVLNSYFLVFHKDRPGRFVITSRRLVYVPELVSQWFGATRVAIEQEQVERVEALGTLSGGTLNIVTLDGVTHRFAMPNLVLDPLQKRLAALPSTPPLDLASITGELEALRFAEAERLQPEVAPEVAAEKDEPPVEVTTEETITSDGETVAPERKAVVSPEAEVSFAPEEKVETVATQVVEEATITGVDDASNKSHEPVAETAAAPKKKRTSKGATGRSNKGQAKGKRRSRGPRDGETG